MSDKLIIFDLDNTILNGDSDYSWIKFMIDSGQVDHDEYTKRNEYFYEQYYHCLLYTSPSPRDDT